MALSILSIVAYLAAAGLLVAELRREQHARWPWLSLAGVAVLLHAGVHVLAWRASGGTDLHVFAALSLFFLIPFGLQTLVVLLGIAAIVLLFMPNSNSFFKAVAARKFGIYGR